MLEKALFGSGSEDFVCKVAESVEEATELIKFGEFVNEIEDYFLYRKRK